MTLEIIEKVPRGGDSGGWNEYQLTKKGRDLFPVINALMAWGDAYEAPNGPPAIFEHACGHPAGHQLTCQACGDELTADNESRERKKLR